MVNSLSNTTQETIPYMITLMQILMDFLVDFPKENKTIKFNGVTEFLLFMLTQQIKSKKDFITLQRSFL